MHYVCFSPYHPMLWCSTCFYRYKVHCEALLCREINKAGLPLIYEILMDTAAADIQRALHIIAAAAESNTPQLLFCKLGKDRTGLMSALVLACCGATDEEIIADYARSDGTDEVALGGMEKKRELQGMDRQLFASAPPEAMRVTLEYAKTKYGGLRGYMETIGFDKAAQRRLGEALSPETAW